MSWPEISPRVKKAALIGFDAMNPLASIIVFQYNPESLSRTVRARTQGDGEQGRSEPVRLAGPPVETISIEVAIDATDQLEKGAATATTLGIHPQLAALEMLLYPKTADVIADLALLAGGTIEVLGKDAPMALFVWGHKRILPVRITEMSITEEFHDPDLNPIRATVSLEMRVLTYSDLSITHPGFALSLAQHVSKEILAVVGSGGNAADVLGGNVDIL